MMQLLDFWLRHGGIDRALDGYIEPDMVADANITNAYASFVASAFEFIACVRGGCSQN